LLSYYLIALSVLIMKTITLKADDSFDAMLSRLAVRLGTTRSDVIREAVRSYERQLDRDALRHKIREASRKTRDQAAQIQSELDAAVGDGL
tara:strand:+ start:617 stop:889 length:273 start_codon:yes stop_codon:yes gene_type:complete